MALFRRKKDSSVLPEVDKYYEGERRDRPVMAWLLALISIAVVALIIVLLFLGGRWVYDRIVDNDSEETVTTSDTDDAPSFDGTPEGTSEDQTGDQTDTGTAQPSTPNDSTPATVSPGDAGSTNPSQPTAAVPATTPQTGDDPLPKTGAGDLVGVFVGVSAVAGGAHYVVQRRKAHRI